MSGKTPARIVIGTRPWRRSYNPGAELTQPKVDNVDVAIGTEGRDTGLWARAIQLRHNKFQTRTSGPLYRGNQPTSHQIQLVKAFNSVGANLKLLISKSLMGLGPLGCVKNGCPELDILPAVC